MTTTAAPAHLATVPTRGAAVRPTPRAVSLLARARSLHAQARLVNPIVAQAYVRRAAELQRAARADQAWRASADPHDAPAAA